jgi:hypothetical protein
MKIWYGYGSEHSMNLVMIGRFEDAADAASAKRLIDQLIALVVAEEAAGRLRIGEPEGRFSDEARALLARERVHSLYPFELEQFAYDVRVEHDGTTIVIKTDESDVSGFLKVLLDHKARVDVYSAHFHPTTKAD